MKKGAVGGTHNGLQLLFVMQVNSRIDTMSQIVDDYYYDPEKNIGRGNYSMVFVGYSTKRQKKLAVKVIRAQVYRKVSSYCQREIDILLGLSHPNIVKLYGSHLDSQDNLFLFFEYCQAGSLEDLIERRHDENKKRITFSNALHYIEQLLEVMKYLFSAKIVHRDIKPANILVDHENNIKLADFGLSRNFDKKMTIGVGSPGYGAPEVLQNREINGHQCDVWSLGVVFYELLSGREFYQIETYEQFISMIPNLEHVISKISYHGIHRLMVPLLQKMLVYDGTKRATFDELATEFRKKVLQQVIKESNSSGKSLLDSSSLLSSSKRIEIEPDERIKLIEKELKYVIGKLNLLLVLYKNDFVGSNMLFLWNMQKFLANFLTVGAYLNRSRTAISFYQKKKEQVADDNAKVVLIDSFLKDIQQKREKLLLSMKDRIIGRLKKYLTPENKENQVHKLFVQYDRKYKVLQMMNRIQESGESDPSCRYLVVYSQVIKEPKYYISNQKLSMYPLQDQEVYLNMVLIGHIDKYFPDKDYSVQPFETVYNRYKDNLQSTIAKYN